MPVPPGGDWIKKIAHIQVKEKLHNVDVGMRGELAAITLICSEVLMKPYSTPPLIPISSGLLNSSGRSMSPMPEQGVNMRLQGSHLKKRLGTISSTHHTEQEARRPATAAQASH